MSTARDPRHRAGQAWQSRLPHAPGTEEDQARLYRIILDAAQEFGIAGVMPWCLHSYPTQEKGFLTPAESMFGLIRPDGTSSPRPSSSKTGIASGPGGRGEVERFPRCWQKRGGRKGR
jgi:hypothetical protein